MEITIIRHGPSAYQENRRVTGKQFGAWISAYNAAGISAAVAPPRALVEKTRAVGLVVSSNLKRAIESATCLDASRLPWTSPLLREAELPAAFPTTVRLPPSVWAGLARTAWLLGWSPHTESVQEARERARHAAETLGKPAAEHASLLVVGHGIFNQLVVWELRRSGWRGPRRSGRSPWASAVYRKDAP